MSIYYAQRTQLALFDQQAAKPLLPVEETTVPSALSAEYCSEIALSGQPRHCLALLAPMLKALSEQQEQRWLTLVSPPVELTRQWLKGTGLDTERTLIIYPKGLQSSQELVCQVLSLGRSHTVISWLNLVAPAAKQCLAKAAEQGNAHSINIAQSW